MDYKAIRFEKHDLTPTPVALRETRAKHVGIGRARFACPLWKWVGHYYPSGFNPIVRCSMFMVSPMRLLKRDLAAFHFERDNTGSIESDTEVKRGTFRKSASYR